MTVVGHIALSVVSVLLLAALLVICWLLYLDKSMRQAVREIVDNVDAAEHGKPCRHPGCMIARSKLRILVGRRPFPRLHRHRHSHP